MDARRHSPAAERNKDPILEVLRRVFPETGLALEIASGSGQHAAHFARDLSGLTWQPTEAEAGALPSIAAWTEELENVRPPVVLDVRERPWPVERADALFNANMIHISPWEVTRALFSGAADVLPDGAPLVTYGPYKRDGRHTAPSNEAFDASLRARDPSWGVRDVESVIEMARDAGFDWLEMVPMPANNFCVLFVR